MFLNTVFDLDPVDLKGNIAKFNVFNSVEFIILAWDQVTEQTIKNCFTKLYNYHRENAETSALPAERYLNLRIPALIKVL